jgi:hypothetical protein
MTILLYPYNSVGFDLKTRNYAGRDDTTSLRRLANLCMLAFFNDNTNNNNNNNNNKHQVHFKTRVLLCFPGKKPSSLRDSNLRSLDNLENDKNYKNLEQSFFSSRLCHLCQCQTLTTSRSRVRTRVTFTC